MKKRLLLFLVGLSAFSGYTQNVLITGKIVDRQHLSLPGAHLKIVPGNRYTISDGNGNFEFLNVPATENYTVEVSYIGYKPVSQTISDENGDHVLEVNFTLEETPVKGEEIVIMGDRMRGQAKALNQQKSNQNITNIVSADQVGRFPDANIGDAMKRIPGITMQNDQGEARNIIIRGLAPALNSVTLNGNRIPSAEGDNRNVQMDLIPSDMIQTIEVNKTLTSDMDADAIGGSVNLITRAAPNGQRVSATLSGGINPIRGKALYSAGLIYGNRFWNNKLGLVISGSYNSNDYGSDNVEATWAQDDAGNIYIEEQDIRKYDVKRVRRSASAALDYEFNKRNHISFNAIYNWRDDWENRYKASMKDLEPEYDAIGNISGFTGNFERETKGGIDNNRVKSARLEQQVIQSYSLRGDHLLGNAVDMDWGLSYSKAKEYRPNERYMQYEAEGVDYGPDFGPTTFPLLQPAGTLSAEDFELADISENTDETWEDELGLRLNFRVPLTVVEDQKGRLRFGVRLRLKNKIRENEFYEYAPTDNRMEHLGLVDQANWPGKNWQAGEQYVPGTFASNDFLGRLDLSNTNLFERETVPDEFLPLNYNAREIITAGYLRWDQDFSTRLSMIAGVRLENTSTKYEANIIMDEEDLEGTRTIDNNYLNILPNLAFRYLAKENLIFRAAVTTSLARPDYYALSPFVNMIPEDQEIEAGNSDLNAAYAWNLDLMAEYYFQSVGLISAGIFYKNINNFIYTFRDEKYTLEEFAGDFPDLDNPIPEGENWTLFQARNGDNVNVYGFELALQRQLDFLPGKFLKGFGVYVNYTFTKSVAEGIYNEDGDLRTDLMLPGTTPHMFNASLAWENKKFSTRVSLNYAAAYLDELGGDSFDDRYYDKQLFLDVNASYSITKNLRIFAEANNLTNQPLRYYQGIVDRTMQMEYYRQRYNIGLKFDLTKR